MNRAPKGSLNGRICTVDGCCDPMYSREMCKRHYKQMNNAGAVRSDRRGTHGTPAQRFWNYVQPGDPGDCWEWQGRRDKDGYGTVRTTTSMIRAHRVSYVIHKGEIPAALVVRHTCHNPCCVNPAHLLTGTTQDNVMDKVLAGRCPRNESHPNCKFSDEVVESVRASSGPAHAVGARFQMSPSHVRNIRRGEQRLPTKVAPV